MEPRRSGGPRNAKAIQRRVEHITSEHIRIQWRAVILAEDEIVGRQYVPLGYETTMAPYRPMYPENRQRTVLDKEPFSLSSLFLVNVQKMKVLIKQGSAAEISDP